MTFILLCAILPNAPLLKLTLLCFILLNVTLLNVVGPEHNASQIIIIFFLSV